MVDPKVIMYEAGKADALDLAVYLFFGNGVPLQLALETLVCKAHWRILLGFFTYSRKFFFQRI